MEASGTLVQRLRRSIPGAVPIPLTPPERRALAAALQLLAAEQQQLADTEEAQQAIALSSQGGEVGRAITPHFDDLIAELAAHLAHTRGMPLDLAERAVRKLVDEAWVEYQAAGAPLGDDDAALVLWIVRQGKWPPPA
jgi:hypothetical protein